MEVKRGIILATIVFILLINLTSAEIIINQQPKEVYNLGDTITIPTTVKTTIDLTDVLKMDLICNGIENNFYKNGVSLASGEEKKIEASLVLTKNVIGELKGDCKVKASLGVGYVLTNNFRISDLVNINVNFSKIEFNPGEIFLIKGEAVLETGKPMNGYIDLDVVEGNNTILNQAGTVNNGFFSINITFPNDMKAGSYFVKLHVYEKDILEEITNQGYQNQNIKINQIPTSLEIVFDNTEVEPGTEVKVKAILHDQTGEKIDSQVFLTIKNKDNKILEQVEKSTDEFMTYSINYNEQSAIWKVVATSNKLTSESIFNILEKESANIEILNRTVIITNTGNVPYNKTVLVKIGNQSLNIDVYLKVDEIQKYTLAAPDGEYNVEVISADGKNISASAITLTGDAIDIKKASSSVGSLVEYPLVWIFIIFILAIMILIVFKRGYQKTFIGYIGSKIHRRSGERGGSGHSSDIGGSNGNRGELTLSIKGDKQDASVVTIKVKNMSSFKSSEEGNAKEVIKKIIGVAEEHKAIAYESNDNIFLIFAPAKTRTFKNEIPALKMAERIKKILDEHNRLFKEKIEYGISIDYGTIVAKQERDSFKFMAMGNFMGHLKKMASLAKNEIFMGEKITDKVRTHVKTQVHERDGIKVYSIKELKDTEENKKFINSFMKRMEKEKK